MATHYDLNDEQFEQQFKVCQFNPAMFSHEAHLRLAYIHINKYGVEIAIQHICSQLLAFVEMLGATDKYNKTLTIAAIRAVNHFISRYKGNNFSEFIEHWPRLNYNFKELMAAHYQIDIYNSPNAKSSYLEPDLLPFS